MNYKKSIKILFISIFVLLFSCNPSYIKTVGWAEETLNNLSLREKIAQMMIYRMNLRFKDIPKEKWESIIELIEKDGIGGIHFWYGEVQFDFLNEMQIRSKVLF